MQSFEESACPPAELVTRGGPATSPLHPSMAAATRTLPSSEEVPSAAMAAATRMTPAKQSSTQRRVATLLDITASQEMKHLASYVDDVLPGYFCPDRAGAVTAAAAEGLTDAAAASPPILNSTKAISSAVLRGALDRRAIDVHQDFLQEFALFYQNYQRAAARVTELQAKCSSLEAALRSPEGPHATEAESFLYQIEACKAELQLVRHHDQEADAFRAQYHFGAAEQQLLEDGPVDLEFLKALEQARQVYRHCSALMQSQDYHQGAAAVVESSYAAIVKATEKIARHLLSAAGSANSGSDSSSRNAAPSAGGRGLGSLAADVPELTRLQVCCMRVLREENPTLREKVLDEIARLRRASVLRRFFHLLTTGSANTSTGLYRSGGQPATNEGHVGARQSGDGTGMGARPLEAELHNPPYFFGSLCAWLHQVVVEEKDFFVRFFEEKEEEGAAGAKEDCQVVQSTSMCSAALSVDAEARAGRHARDSERLRALLDSVFGGVCKHIGSALEDALERLSRQTVPLGAPGASAERALEDSGHSTGAAAERDTECLAATTSKGPRGLTGGLTRLFMAATGRSPLGGLGSRRGESDANVLLQRYANVTTRAQQEAVASSMLKPPLQGIQTCVALMHLFEYYTVTTFVPLLGENAVLTKLLSETAPQRTRVLLLRLLHGLSHHLLDSTVGLIRCTAVLHRLASSNQGERQTGRNVSAADVRIIAPQDTETTTATEAAASTGNSTFVLDFLSAFTYAKGVDNGSLSNASRSSILRSDADSFSTSPSSAAPTLSRWASRRSASEGPLQSHQAQDLQRVLVQLVLPPSPEIVAYSAALCSILEESARQREVLRAMGNQRKATPAHIEEAPRSGPASAMAPLVCELLQVLWKAALSVQAEDGPLQTNLDDPCRAIVEYNILHQLRGVFDQSMDSLRTILDDGSGGSDNTAMAALEVLQCESADAMAALRARLLSMWATAVTHFYFAHPTEALVTSVATQGATGEAEQHRMSQKKEVRQALHQIVNVYNTIASLGHLPEPVPLLQALCDGDKLTGEVRATVTKAMVEVVYPREFAALRLLPPSEEALVVQNEMAPQNLAALVDLSSPISTSPGP